MIPRWLPVVILLGIAIGYSVGMIFVYLIF